MTSGYGVLDLGATETVGSLEALEALMSMRAEIHGNQEPVEVFTGPSSKKPFRFGNVMVPQRLGEQLVMLGLYTIDAEKVPILIGMKTLVKLGAIIDVYGQWMVLSHVSPEVKIPLAKSKAGHLLVNLTMDWLNVSQPLQILKRGGAYMASSGSVTVEKASGETLRSLESEVQLSTVLPSVTCGQPVVGDVWMIEDGDEDALPDDDMPEDVFLMDQQHAHHPLPLATQEMRDNILQQLVQPYTNSDNSTSHAAQESNDRDQGQQAEADTSSRGEVRLVSNSRSRSPRCSDSRSSMLRESPSPETRQDGLGQWLESMGALDGMRGVWGSHGMWRSRWRPRSRRRAAWS